MIRTYSVKDGGRLCKCGHLKAEHYAGTGTCSHAGEKQNLGFHWCIEFRDRAPETAEAA